MKRTKQLAASSRRRRKTWAVALALVLLVFGAATSRLFVWPVLPPLPAKADAIIELGGPGDRDTVALALARDHRSPVLVQSTLPLDATSDTCLPPIDGVRIMCIYADPPTTRGEAEYIGRLASEHHWRSVILVTTPDQAWRARLRVSRCFDGAVYVSTTPLPALRWFTQIPYQWAASVKALTVERTC